MSEDPPPEYASTQDSRDRARALARAREQFAPIWTVYDHPLDQPAHWVVRCWWGILPDPTAYLFNSLEAARMWIEQEGGSVLLVRSAGDERCIVESWI